jgi:hypothetical protein
VALLALTQWALFADNAPPEVPDENKQRGFEVLTPR